MAVIVSEYLKDNEAFMIRNDGKVIPVNIHIYGDKDDAEETFRICQWLYDYTKESNTKNLIITFIKTYAINELGALDSDLEDIIKLLKDNIYDLNSDLVDSMSTISEDFIDKHKEEISKAKVKETYDLVEEINDSLNQEFLRARFGGMYDSNSDKTMYFRISSTGFDWFNIIWNFVNSNKNQIDKVSVLYDVESTGKSDYLTHNNQKIKEMPVQDFITLSGNPIFESREV